MKSSVTKPAAAVEQCQVKSRKVPFWQFFRKADMALYNPKMKKKYIMDYCLPLQINTFGPKIF